MSQRALKALQEGASEGLEGLNKLNEALPNGSKTLVAAKALQEEQPQEPETKVDFSPFIIEGTKQGDMNVPSPEGQAGLPPSTGMWGLLGFLSQMALLRPLATRRV